MAAIATKLVLEDCERYRNTRAAADAIEKLEELLEESCETQGRDKEELTPVVIGKVHFFFRNAEVPLRSPKATTLVKKPYCDSEIDEVVTTMAVVRAFQQHAYNFVESLPKKNRRLKAEIMTLAEQNMDLFKRTGEESLGFVAGDETATRPEIGVQLSVRRSWVAPEAHEDASRSPRRRPTLPAMPSKSHTLNSLMTPHATLNNIASAHSSLQMKKRALLLQSPTNMKWYMPPVTHLRTKGNWMHVSYLTQKPLRTDYEELFGKDFTEQAGNILLRSLGTKKLRAQLTDSTEFEIVVHVTDQHFSSMLLLGQDDLKRIYDSSTGSQPLRRTQGKSIASFL